MAKWKPGIGFIIVWLCLSCAMNAAAGTHSKKPVRKPPNKVSFDIRLAAQYNSNVSVTELDNVSGADDRQLHLYAGVKYRTVIGPKTSLTARASYSQTTHSKFSRFDLQTNYLSADIVRDIGKLDIGVYSSFYDSKLNHNGFISSWRVSPYVKKRFGKKVLTRLYYAHSDKNFDVFKSRNAHENEGGLSLYYFLHGSREYIQTQYAHKQVNSTGPQFDYGANKALIRYNRRFTYHKKRLRVRAAYRYEQRDYNHPTPSISAIRHDKRHRFIGDIEIPFNKKIFGKFEYQHAINHSNLPVVDYNRDLLTATIGARF